MINTLKVCYIFFILLLSACGVKNYPYHESATLPGQVLDINAELDAKDMVWLSWNAPEYNMVNRTLKDLGGFVIYRSDNHLNDSYCAGCPHKFEKIEQIPLLPAPPGMLYAKGPYKFHQQLQKDHVYKFRIFAMNSNGSFHPNSFVEKTILVSQSLPLITDFQAKLTEKAVKLTWKAVKSGVELEKRAINSNIWEKLSVTGAKPEYLDLNVEYDKVYAYRARTFSQQEDAKNSSPWTQELLVEVFDITAPPPPSFVDVSLANKGINIKWESLAADPDLLGYRLYRRLANEDKFKKVGPDIITENTYFDPIDISEGEEIRYRVTSIDKSSRQNESEASPEGTIFWESAVDSDE